MNVVFLGTPSFAVPSLNALLKSSHRVIAVVTQPDKKVGREQKVVFSPVKQTAIDNDVKVLQYEKIRLQGVEELKNLNPDIMVSCAYGQILSKEIIDIAPHGIINVHGSLLPKYRGAAPIQQAVIDGEKQTGITIMQTETGIDTGDILSVVKTDIGENETAGELFDRLSVLGAELLIETLDKIQQGEVSPVKQDERFATHVSMIKKEDGLINWSDDALTLFNKVRGMNPWPIAFTWFKGKILKIYKSSVVKENFDGKIGQIVCCDLNGGIVVKCGNDCLKIEELQLEGGKRLAARDFILGRKMSLGDVLS